MAPPKRTADPSAKLRHLLHVGGRVAEALPQRGFMTGMQFSAGVWGVVRRGIHRSRCWATTLRGFSGAVKARFLSPSGVFATVLASVAGLGGCSSSQGPADCPASSTPSDPEAVAALADRYADGRSWCLLMRPNLGFANLVGLEMTRNRVGSWDVVRFDPPDRIRWWGNCDLKRPSYREKDPDYFIMRAFGFFDRERLAKQHLRMLPHGGYADDTGTAISGQLPTGEAITYVISRETGDVRIVQLAVKRFVITASKPIAAGGNDMICGFPECPDDGLKATVERQRSSLPAHAGGE